ncbi:Amidohydro-3 domain-containing protein [Mycena sanguinolenta]|uniref:Amidohydro-3 domain-containing protein n=1 Tax=Mycena sanguinolenta TaxID=230812 RepID=A0A8H7DCD2_9AGAR|nr:Amidohydro-3 domain-containing protein [Mycena sanguinolenta]
MRLFAEADGTTPAGPAPRGRRRTFSTLIQSSRAVLSCCGPGTVMRSGCRAESWSSAARSPQVLMGGAILTDASGTATGMLLDNAQELLDIPPLTEHDLMQRFTTAVTDALAYGLTSVHDANLNPALLAFFSRQALRRTIQIRIYAMGFFNETEPYLGNDISKLTPPPSERLTARSVKIFADGKCNPFLLSRSELNGVFFPFRRPGNRRIWGELQQSRRYFWLRPDPQLCEPYTLDSDFPVKTMNPLASFYAAITRVSVNGDSPHGPGGWFPEERLRREEALRGITIDPASVSFSESYLGSLEPGKRADFTVLSRNIMEIPPPEILDVKVMATVIDGAVAYGAL